MFVVHPPPIAIFKLQRRSSERMLQAWIITTYRGVCIQADLDLWLSHVGHSVTNTLPPPNWMIFGPGDILGVDFEFCNVRPIGFIRSFRGSHPLTHASPLFSAIEAPLHTTYNLPLPPLPTITYHYLHYLPLPPLSPLPTITSFTYHHQLMWLQRAVNRTAAAGHIGGWAVNRTLTVVGTRGGFLNACG